MRAAVVVLMLLLTANGCPAGPPPAKPSTSCHEGDACWNCKTMGNRRCGTPDPARQDLVA